MGLGMAHIVQNLPRATWGQSLALHTLGVAAHTSGLSR